MPIKAINRVKTRVFRTPDGVTGDAFFSDDGLHRYWLSRERPKPRTRTLLWVGMNPSEARAGWDDPTVETEWDVTQRNGFNRYLKCNVFSRITPFPDDLIGMADDLVRDLTYTHMENCAREAQAVVVCFGNIRPMLLSFAATTLELLRKHHKNLYCVGYNQNMLPRHSLYMKRDKKLIRYEGHSCRLG